MSKKESESLQPIAENQNLTSTEKEAPTKPNKRKNNKSSSGVEQTTAPKIDSLNELEIYFKNSSKKGYKGKHPISVLADNIKIMSKDEFIGMFQYIIDIFKNSSLETKNKETEIKKLLTENSYIFVEKYFEYIVDALPLIKTISKKVDFSYTPVFSQDPIPAIYGITHTDKDITRSSAPLKGEQIKRIIDAYLANDLNYYAGLWLFETINFVPVKMCANFSNENGNDIINVSNEIKKLTLNNSSYQTAIGYYFCNDGTSEIKKIVNSESEFKSKIDFLENERTNLVQKYNQNQETIQHQQAIINDLNQRSKSFDELRQKNENLKMQINDVGERYILQRSMNEDLQRAHREKIKCFENKSNELADQINKLSKELTNISKTNDELTITNNNLLSDLQTERIRLSKNKEETNKIVNEAKNDMISDFINFIAEPINHFTKAFDCFETNKEFDDMTLEICKDSLNDIIDGLKNLNINPIGEYGVVAPYNRNLHYCEGNISEGSPVRVEKIGWMFDNTIIKKADVESSEE